jgi:rhamnulokinase
MTKRYLAFDLGAESGRAIAGTLEDDRMTLDVLHRFPNGPVRLGDTIYWDVLGIHRELKTGLAAYAAKYGKEVAGVATDSWGVDFALLDAAGAMLSNPVHYRDARNDGMPEALGALIPIPEVYHRTGIQIMQINTIFQLFSMVKAKSPLLGLADTMLCMADLQNYFLSGARVQEYSLASTTQMLDPHKRRWAKDLLKEAGIPTAMLPDIVEPGTHIGDLLAPIAEECGVAPCPVIASACHDTAAAVAAVPATGDKWLYLSSGTWSLLGAELPEPLVNERTAELNFTNEGGVCNTIRFLKNISGLWLVQQSRATFERQGRVYDYAELTKLAGEAAPLRTLLDPDDPAFGSPGDMPARMAEQCGRTGEPAPDTHGAVIRAALESLALRYRMTIEAIEEVTGRTYDILHIVGGGTQNKLLNQFAADATGKLVEAGPVEATAFGNCLMQAIALGDIVSLADARAIVRNSTEVETYEPSPDRSAWQDAYGRFKETCAG